MNERQAVLKYMEELEFEIKRCCDVLVNDDWGTNDFEEIENKRLSTQTYIETLQKVVYDLQSILDCI